MKEGGTNILDSPYPRSLRSQFSTLEATVPLHLASPPFLASASTIGLTFLALVIPNSISAILSGWVRDKWGSKWVLYTGLLTTALIAPLLAVPDGLAGFCVVMGVYGVTSAAAVAPSLPELSILVPPTLSGRIYALFNITFSLGVIIGPLIGGAVYPVSTIGGLPNQGRLMGPMLVVAAFHAGTVPLMTLYLWLKRERDQVEAGVKWEEKWGVQAREEADKSGEVREVEKQEGKEGM